MDNDPTERGFVDKYGDDLTVSYDTYLRSVYLTPMDADGDYTDLAFTPKKALKVAKAIKKAAKAAKRGV